MRRRSPSTFPEVNGVVSLIIRQREVTEIRCRTSVAIWVATRNRQTSVPCDTGMEVFSFIQISCQIEKRVGRKGDYYVRLKICQRESGDRKAEYPE